MILHGKDRGFGLLSIIFVPLRRCNLLQMLNGGVLVRLTILRPTRRPDAEAGDPFFRNPRLPWRRCIHTINLNNCMKQSFDPQAELDGSRDRFDKGPHPGRGRGRVCRQGLRGGDDSRDLSHRRRQPGGRQLSFRRQATAVHRDGQARALFACAGDSAAGLGCVNACGAEAARICGRAVGSDAGGRSGSLARAIDAA